MSYIIRKKGANCFITRTKNGRYFTDRRIKNGFIFSSVDIAQSILDLFLKTDPDRKPGEWEIVSTEKATQEKILKKINPNLLRKREERNNNLDKLTDNDLNEIIRLRKDVGMFPREIAIIYGISTHVVTRIVKQRGI